jgi:eukaryotic-like serine/threonine-protein kinase
MSRLRDLVREIHRRSLWQVVGIYLVGSWLGYQVILGVTDGLSLPDWVPPLAFVLFIIGLPVVVATAFINEGPPVLGPRDPTRLPGLEPGSLIAWDDPPCDDAAAASAAHAAAPAAAPARSGSALRVLTWRRALLAGASAFVVLGASAGSYAGMRVAGIGPVGTLIAAGRLDADEPILLAEFRAVGVDTLLARALTDALRVDLEQSRVVTLAQPSFVADALRRMQLDPLTSLDEVTARALAAREGFAAIITGDVTAVSGQWVVTTRIIEPSTGVVLAAYRESVTDSMRVVDALGRASRKLRAKIGESLRDVRAAEPLAQVTTPSLEALRAYSQAMRLSHAGAEHRDRVIALLEQAIVYDTLFAMAYRKLGIEYGNDPFNQTRASEMLTKAYRHLDRLTEPERYITIGSYHGAVTGDRNQQLAAYQTLYELHPTFQGAATNYGFALSMLRRHDRAIEVYRHAVALDTTLALPLSNLVFGLLQVGDVAEAEATIDVYRRRFPDNLQSLVLASFAATARFDYVRGDSIGAELQRRATGATLRLTAAAFRSLDLAVLGRFASAAEQQRQALRVAEQMDARNAVYLTFSQPANARLMSGAATPASVVADLDAALAAYPLDTAPLYDRAYLTFAAVYAHAGGVERARSLVAAYRREMPEERQRTSDELPAAEGAIALAEGRYRDALRLYRAAHDAVGCNVCYLAEIAVTHDRMGDADAALEAYGRYLSTPAIDRRFVDPAWLGRVLERIAQLHDDAGRAEEARRYYAQFVELWSEADPVLHARVEAARRRIGELLVSG